MSKLDIQPGIYHDLSNKDYHSSTGLSKSRLQEFLDNQYRYHFNYVLGNKPQEERKKHFDVGGATHLAVFQPDLIPKEIAISPEYNRRKKAEKEAEQEFLAAHPDHYVLTQKDYDEVMYISDAVWSHPKAGQIVQAKGIAEQSVYAVDPGTGLLVKCRPDWTVESLHYQTDLKTSRSAAPGFFSREMFNRGYYLQGGMYNSVSQEAGLDVHYFGFIVVEKEPPYCVAVYEMTKEDMQAGKDVYEAGLRLFKKCLVEDVWPGYNNDQIIRLGMPTWGLRSAQELSDNLGD